MALTRSTLAASIQSQTGVSKSKAMETVGSIIDIIKETLDSGEDVLISNFGKFQVKEKGERRGRNPGTAGS